MTTIASLAKEMNATPKQVSEFLSCLKVWTDKGYTVEQAIHQHMLAMESLAKGVTARPNSADVYSLNSMCADAVWNAVNA